MDAVLELNKGVCVNLQTRGGSKFLKILGTYLMEAPYLAPSIASFQIDLTADILDLPRVDFASPSTHSFFSASKYPVA